MRHPSAAPPSRPATPATTPMRCSSRCGRITTQICDRRRSPCGRSRIHPLPATTVGTIQLHSALTRAMMIVTTAATKATRRRLTLSAALWRFTPASRMAVERRTLSLCPPRPRTADSRTHPPPQPLPQLLQPLQAASWTKREGHLQAPPRRKQRLPTPTPAPYRQTTSLTKCSNSPFWTAPTRSGSQPSRCRCSSAASNTLRHLTASYRWCRSGGFATLVRCQCRRYSTTPTRRC